MNLKGCFAGRWLRECVTGKVYKAMDKKSGEVVALKRVFLLNVKSEGVSLLPDQPLLQ